MAQKQLAKPTKAPHIPSFNHEYPPQPTNPQKPLLPAQARRISLSIVVMSIPVLYVFLLHLSPPTLLKDTKFWFLLSNTIIIVIAADSGVFSASTDGSEGSSSEIYDEYIRRTRQMRPRQLEHMRRRGVSYELHKTDDEKEPLGISSAEYEKPYSPENRRISIQTNATDRFQHEPTASSTKAKQLPHHEPLVLPPTKQQQQPPVDAINGAAAKRYRPCKTSEVPLVLRNRIHGKEVTVSRSATFPYANKAHNERNDAAFVRAVETGNDEYSTMSDEELNRRVEEFIRKVNRQIRLQ